MGDLDQEENPYQTPAELSSPIDPLPTRTGAALLRQFSSEIRALGIAWMVFSAIGFLFVAATQNSSAGNWRDLPTNFGDLRWWVNPISLLLPFAISLFPFGFFACFKRVGAVQMGLVLNYVALAISLVTFNLCGAILLLLAIFQAHRVLGYAQELQKAGIALHLRPDQLDRST